MNEFAETYPLPSGDAIKEFRRVLGDNLPKRSLFEEYKPKEEWFLRQSSMKGIHGMTHEARVMVWQEILSRLLIKEGANLDQEALRWAAAIHDTQRLDDNYDFGHGERAAEWAEKELGSIIPGPTLKKVIFIVRWHVPSDTITPEMTPELAVFKDADGIDRARLGDLSLKLLRHDMAKRLLVQPGDDLYSLSSQKQWEKNGELFDCVMEAAVELRIIQGG